MRIIGEIPHPELKITLFHWNNRYIIKLESGFLEQTFKIDAFDIIQESDLQQLTDQQFITESILRFQEMEKSLGDALNRISDY